MKLDLPSTFISCSLQKHPQIALFFFINRFSWRYQFCIKKETTTGMNRNVACCQYYCQYGLLSVGEKNCYEVNGGTTKRNVQKKKKNRRAAGMKNIKKKKPRSNKKTNLTGRWSAMISSSTVLCRRTGQRVLIPSQRRCDVSVSSIWQHRQTACFEFFNFPSH